MLKVIFFTFAVVVICVGAWNLSHNSEQKWAPQALRFGSSLVPDQISDSQNFLAYEDSAYGFRVGYPKDLELQIFDEADGSRVVVFGGDSPGLGFQVFIVPYSENVITEERFKIDAPSGVMIEPIDISIDGAPAKAFIGYNEMMGETRDVWFIKNGYLYEVTTYKALDSWLGEIMTTWKFM
jgi:hypothetical protein